MATSIDASRLRATARSLLQNSASAAARQAVSWSESQEDGTWSLRRKRSDNPLLDMLENRMSGLDSALRRFSWPNDDSILSTARLIVQSPALDGKLASSLPEADEVAPFYKFFSKGFDPNARHDLGTKTYSMTLALGSRSSTLSIALDSEQDTWGEALDAIADAVNASALPVQAAIVQQSAPYQRIATLGRTGGAILTLSVERAYNDQDLELDFRQALPRTLDFQATEAPQTPAQVKRWDLTGLQAAVPSTFFAGVFDPNEDAGLTPGIYHLSYTLGEASSTFGVAVTSNATFGDVLQSTAQAINSSQSDFRAEVQKADRVVYLDPEGRYTTRGETLMVYAVAPKLGERLMLYEASAPSEASFLAPGPTPPIGENGDRYISLATENGWTADQVYTWGGQPYAWYESSPSVGDVYYVSDLGANYRYSDAGWIESSALTEALGLSGSAWPGVDGKLRVDGEELTAATSTFSFDSGRVVVDLQVGFGDTLPLRVAQGMQALEEQTSDVIMAYDSLRRFVLSNDKAFVPGLAELWRTPARARQEDLTWAGVQEIEAQRLLWIDGDRFWSSLLEDPERAQATFWWSKDGKPGLIPSLKAVNDALRSQGLDKQTRTTTRPSSQLPWRREFENERDAVLLDLFG